MNVAVDLFEFLHNQDRAELPGLGTFVACRQSATISPLTGTIEPPCRSIAFKQEESGDMTFVRSMAEKEFISEQTALVWIKQYTQSVKEKLDLGQKCKIGALGEMSKDFSGAYVFVPQVQNLLDDAFAFSTLKNVKTFDAEEKIEPIRTREPLEDLPQEPLAELPKEQEQSQELVEEPKEQQLPEEELSHETVSHTEAVIAEELDTPEPEQEVKEELQVDTTPEQEAELQPIEKEVEIEDITPQSQSVREQAQAIIEENKRQKEQEKERLRQEKEEHKRRKKAKKRRKRILITVLIILLFLLLCCGGFVLAFYFNALPDKPFLKPITERLAYYITPQAKPVKLAAPAVETPAVVEEIAESETTEEEIVPLQEEVVEPAKPQKPQTSPTNTAKKQVAKKSEKKENTTTPAPKPASEDNSPVVVQNYSKLGFDVIGGSFTNKANAERLARKAKSLGYDSYVLSKVKSGTPIYYVSYGSRRTLKEANDLMAKMTESLGGEYYVISR